MKCNYLSVFMAAFFILNSLHPLQGQGPDAIYFNGSIRTMIRDGHQVEALAVRGGVISATGPQAEVMAQKGDALPPFLKLLEAGDKAGVLPINVVSYPIYLTANDEVIQKIAVSWKTPARYRLGGIKLCLDGSIQGYTANLSQPYHIQPGGAKSLQDCRLCRP